MSILAENIQVDYSGMGSVLAFRAVGYLIANIFGVILQNIVKKYSEGLLICAFLLSAVGKKSQSTIFYDQFDSFFWFSGFHNTVCKIVMVDIHSIFRSRNRSELYRFRRNEYFVDDVERQSSGTIEHHSIRIWYWSDICQFTCSFISCGEKFINYD